MESLKSYSGAASVNTLLQRGTVYASVVDGKHKGTIGKIVSVKTHHYTKHTYTLEFPNRKVKFCGSVLEITQNTEVTFILNEDFQRVFRDFNDREITVGHRVLFSKKSAGTSGFDMLLGNVRKIDTSGVYIMPFAINGKFSNDTAGLVRIAKTHVAMVVDSSTVNSIMIAKLSADAE